MSEFHSFSFISLSYSSTGHYKEKETKPVDEDKEKRK
jgi:hypothetical protein